MYVTFVKLACCPLLITKKKKNPKTDVTTERALSNVQKF